MILCSFFMIKISQTTFERKYRKQLVTTIFWIKYSKIKNKIMNKIEKNRQKVERICNNLIGWLLGFILKP